MVRVAHAAALASALTPVLAGTAFAQSVCPPPSFEPVAAARRAVTPLDLARLRDIGMPDASFLEMPSPLAISPDGRRVTFLLNQGDPASNRYCRWMMIADIKANARAQVIDSGGELITIKANYRGLLVSVGFPDVVTPGWSADGKWVAYLRRDNGVTQVWRARSDGGATTPATTSAVDVEDWAWLPDGKIVTASRSGQTTETERTDAEGLTGWHYDARITPEYGARPQMRADLPRVFATIDPETGVKRLSTADEIAKLPPERAGGIPPDPNITNARGARAWLATDTPSPISPTRIHYADAKGRERPCTAEACANGLVQIYWSEDGRGIIYMRREGWAKSELAFYHWDPERGVPRRLSVTRDVLLGCLARGSHFLCAREASSQPRRIVDFEPATGISTTIFDPNPEFASLQLGSVERLTWRNNLGLPAWGDLVLPPGPRTNEKLPMIVVQYHSDGFLRGGTGDEYPIFALAARGFAVLSTEDPPTFATAFPNLTNWEEINKAGMKDWADRRSYLSSTLTGVAQVMARGIIDPKRIGITGLSDGASSARFALINSRVFSAAAISSSSLEPKTAMTYGGIAWAEFNRKLGYPPATRDDPLFWKPYSMALNARDMNVPLLIQASEDEYLLSLETFTALRENGKPVDMYVFPKEHHIKWQPAHRLAIYERNIDWFAFWFKGVVDPSPAKAAQYGRWKTLRAQMATSTSAGAPVP